MRTTPLAAAAAISIAALSACSSNTGSTVYTSTYSTSSSITATTTATDVESYDTLFTAARDELREWGYDLARVDATRGVITTRPEVHGGFLRPLDLQRTTFGQQVEDTVVNQQRRIRIEFVPQGEPNGEDPFRDIERRLGEGTPISMRVEITIERRHRPGLRPNTQSIRLTSRTRDPELIERGLGVMYEEPFARDTTMESRLTGRILQRAGSMRDRDQAAE